ncbi:3-hydroxyacyl-CoA dehydrogenase family protein [Crateriforma conspicua]|uniref:Putative 3-hydroxybutyryl-CoA dehydrogenase n=1 Tax=Crateriforma conspicua TaxID=2527996 RepID=A0A5C5XTA5_9PLAN|nr:3-hydroxyacyl-CoA dehydrogenase NAD-binding domain-containing protein [Crateriforma conspicua]QDV61004.1 putative 3-hydroxybutyryl-CoA dehydrogenase [Crateriforma conspicua]TWT65839.1 putative 3-hydroxybutyryl-CoA dehydrogenase [Crateriforma conspicua]
MNLGDIQTIAIAGIGQMGTACAVAFRRAGYRVLLWGRNAEKLAAVQPSLQQMDQWCDQNSDVPVVSGGRIVCQDDVAILDREADVVLDCVVEVMDDKVDVLQKFPSAARRDALFLSATSALSVTEMAARANVTELLVGAHFWNPPHLIPVVEMVRGTDTPESKVQLACDLMQRIGKIPIVCKDVPGFVGNRLLHAMWREALHMIDEQVCSPEDIDRITRLTFALRLPLLGPIENMDYVGLDATERLQRYMAPRLCNQTTPARCLTEKTRSGDLGVKSGKGFYDWSKRDIDQVIRKRDQQVVQQLKWLKDMGEL